MTDTPDLYASLAAQAAGLSLTELQMLHPQMARRTLQRRIEALLHAGRIEARGMGRARRYVALAATPAGTSVMPPRPGRYMVGVRVRLLECLNGSSS